MRGPLPSVGLKVRWHISRETVPSSWSVTREYGSLAIASIGDEDATSKAIALIMLGVLLVNRLVIWMLLWIGFILMIPISWSEVVVFDGVSG